MTHNNQFKFILNLTHIIKFKIFTCSTINTHKQYQLGDPEEVGHLKGKLGKVMWSTDASLARTIR